MDYPQVVAAVARAAAEATASSQGRGPAITVKCRLGIAKPSQFENAGPKSAFRNMLDYFDGKEMEPLGFRTDYEEEQFQKLCQFVDIVSTTSPVEHFVIHARQAALECDLSPTSNRSVPKLSYETVYRLKVGYVTPCTQIRFVVVVL